MAFIRTKQDNITIIINERTREGSEANIGEFLFAFLECDLKKYGKLYDYITSSRSNREKFKKLMEQYSKTAEMLDISLNNITQDDKMYINYILPFLSANQDISFDIYNHPFSILAVSVPEVH